MKRIFFVVLIVLALVGFATPVFALDGNPPAQGIDLVYVGQLLQAIALATIPVLVGAGTRYLLAKYATERARLSSEKQFALDVFIKTAIFAAEQMHAKNYIVDKLDFATARVQDWLTANKFYVDAYEIRARIEAAVFTEFNGFALPPKSENE